MTALGFYEALERAGFGDLGIVIESADERDRSPFPGSFWSSAATSRPAAPV